MFRINLFVYFILTSIFLGPYTYLSQSVDYKLNLIILFIIFLVFLPSINIKLNYLEPIRIDAFNLLITLVLLYVIFTFKAFSIKQMIQWPITLLILLIIKYRENIYSDILIILEKYNKIIALIVIIPILVFISDILAYYNVLNVGFFDLVSFLYNINPYEDLNLDNNNFLNIKLLHFDSYITFTEGDWAWNNKVHRNNAHLVQASLIPNYILLFYGLGLLFEKIGFKISIIIFLFCIISFSGTVHLLIFLSIISYLFFTRLIIYFSFIAPLIIFFVFSVFAYYVHILCSFETQCMSTLGIENNLFFRIGSGLERINLIGHQINTLITNPFYGYIGEYKTDVLLGSFIYSSASRAGIFGFIVSLAIFILLIKYLLKINTKNKTQRFGLIITYFCLLQVFIFQDFGFGSLNGIIILALIIKLLMSKNKEKINLLSNK